MHSAPKPRRVLACAGCCAQEFAARCLALAEEPTEEAGGRRLQLEKKELELLTQLRS